MHKVFKPDEAPEDYNFEEYCPHCDECIPVIIDDKCFSYEMKCPVCGKTLMLCTLCQMDNENADCDYHDGTCCKRGIKS